MEQKFKLKNNNIYILTENLNNTNEMCFELKIFLLSLS